jgi:hypothetical protein
MPYQTSIAGQHNGAVNLTTQAPETVSPLVGTLSFSWA